MADVSDPLSAEAAFFGALLVGDADQLDGVLAPDFLLVDVMTGSLNARDGFLEAVRSGELRFDAIESAETLVRLYPPAAIVTGRTRMSGRFGTEAFTVRSRYTHVFVEKEGRWRLASAQGTPIAE